MRQKRTIKLKTLSLALLIAFSAGYIPQSSADINSEIVVTAEAKDKFSVSDVPKYKDAVSVEVHGNKPMIRAETAIHKTEIAGASGNIC